MDFDQYVAARYGRLIEHAVLLGCAEGEAGTYVDRVLLEQRKRIRRTEDPDPLVHEALERAISGTPERSRRTGPLVAVGLVVVAVAVGAALTYRPPPRPVPSLFALDGSQAAAAARGPGLRRPAPAGSFLRARGAGARVGPAGGHAGPGGRHGDGPHRRTVRRLLSVAVPHPVPTPGTSSASRWAATRRRSPTPCALLVHGSAPRTFTAQEAADGGRWDEAFDLIATAAHRAAPTLDRDAVAAAST